MDFLSNRSIEIIISKTTFITKKIDRLDALFQLSDNFNQIKK